MAEAPLQGSLGKLENATRDYALLECVTSRGVCASYVFAVYFPFLCSLGANFLNQQQEATKQNGRLRLFKESPAPVI